MTPLLCAYAVVVTVETQRCRKRAPRFVEFKFLTNRNGPKRIWLVNMMIFYLHIQEHDWVEEYWISTFCQGSFIRKKENIETPCSCPPSCPPNHVIVLNNSPPDLSRKPRKQLKQHFASRLCQPSLSDEAFRRNVVCLLCFPVYVNKKVFAEWKKKGRSTSGCL